MGTPDQMSMSESSDNGTSSQYSVTSVDTSSRQPKVEKGRYEKYGEWARYGIYGKYGKYGIHGQYGKYGDYGRYGEFAEKVIKEEREANRSGPQPLTPSYVRPENTPTFDEYAAAMQQLYEYLAENENKQTAKDQNAFAYPEFPQPNAVKPHESQPRRKSKMKVSGKGQRSTKKKSKQQKSGTRKGTVVTKTYILNKKH